MYSDLFFNFSQMSQGADPEYGAEIFARMAKSKPFFAMDTGMKADDVWQRAESIRESLDLIEDEIVQKNARQMIYLSAGIMGDYDAIENRYTYIETLEDTINSFRNSDDEFASRLVALGPCGIDHDWESAEYEGRDHEYFDSNTIAEERDLFALEMTLGKKLNLPVIVHSRKGFRETSDVLKAVKWNRGVIHGYSYEKSELDFFLDLGWYISFSGAVTYAGKKGSQDMAELIDYVPKDRLFIETDSPYYAPVPLKNTENTPLNISYIYDYIASKRHVPVSKMGASIEENFKTLFLK